MFQKGRAQDWETSGPTGVTLVDVMSEFSKHMETEIMNVQAQDGIALSMVKGLTEYFHGDSGRWQDQRTRHDELPMPAAPSLPQVFPAFDERLRSRSSDNERPQSRI
ncbi:hypothetical protein SASPL_147873 [Salvia splendens]|uniref:Uncharacterized protein n=1 Tax=Salvia splendens TaxID=180675 RepID=A0A8X8Z744_SALSN|nr:hypothetical protein SASPL_147873 [Salvia splendens]